MNDVKAIRNFCRAYSQKDENLFISRLREEGVSNKDIAAVIRILGGICLECYDADFSCQCANGK